MTLAGVMNRGVRTIFWIPVGNCDGWDASLDARDVETIATLLPCSGGFGKLLMTCKMLRLPGLSPRAVFARRELRGILNDDYLLERCALTN